MNTWTQEPKFSLFWLNLSFHIPSFQNSMKRFRKYQLVYVRVSSSLSSYVELYFNNKSRVTENISSVKICLNRKHRQILVWNFEFEFLHSKIEKALSIYFFILVFHFHINNFLHSKPIFILHFLYQVSNVPSLS